MATPYTESSECSEVSITCQPTRQRGSKECGFECEFVEKPPKAFQAECPVCLQILCEPYQVSCCGNSFCKTCIERIQADNKHCPTCNEENFTTFHNKGLQRSLYQLQVYCTHKQQGCEWTGELGQLDKHLNFNPQPDNQLEGCQYSEIDCMHCSELIQRHTITAHQIDHCPKRQFSCEYCHDYGSEHDDVIKNHWPVCVLFPVRCPNECGTFPQRQNLQTHITNECPLTMIDCDFHNVGCDVKLPRKDMQTHLKENLVTHTSLQVASYETLLARTNQLEIENKRLLNEIATLKENIIVLQAALVPPNQQLAPNIGTPTPYCYEFSMSNYEQHKTANDHWYSPPFYTHPQGYKMCLSVHANGCGGAKGTHVSVLVNLMRGEFDNHLKWPFRGDITIQLVDQERDEEHYLINVAIDSAESDNFAQRVPHFRERQKWSWGSFLLLLKRNSNQNTSRTICSTFELLMSKWTASDSHNY